ncbi:MAG TPA: hypothetical protein PK514_01970, partial [Spirochaetota bacterium]|nr:hypothetical protein [Spirochaetota bacterium]
ILGSLKKEQGNSINGVFIDETLREFFYLKAPIVIPAIPVSSIGHNNASEIVKIVSKVIPGFLAGHLYMEKRNPASEEHSIHLFSSLSGRVVDFIHILRLDFKFSANSGAIVKAGDSATFPSYSTQRIYFKSRLVPVSKGSSTADFDFIRLKKSVRVESGEEHKRLFTSVLFDDFSSREISIELSRKAGDIFGIPVTIYPMVVYDYFTSCLNVPEPAGDAIEKAAFMFEPLFLYMFSDVSGRGQSLVQEGLNAWPDCLESAGEGLTIKPGYSDNLRQYFSCYSLFADDDLMLKGWKKITSC